MELELSDALTIIAILVTAWAIVYEVDKTRRLSRKTTAISLLGDQFMNEQDYGFIKGWGWASSTVAVNGWVL